MAGPGSAAKAKKARRGPRPDLYGGCRFTGVGVRPLALPIALLALDTTQHPLSLVHRLSQLPVIIPPAPPAQAQMEPLMLRRARGARDPRSKAAARAGPHPRSAPPVQIKKVWQCWPPWPGKLRKYGKLHRSLWKPKKPWQRP